MLGILMAALLASAPGDGGDWVVVGRLLTDAYCETAHDDESGVVVRSCASPTAPSLDGSDPRLLSERDEEVGAVGVRILVYAHPGQDVRLIRADIGAEPSCPVAEFLAAYTPPPACRKEMAFLVSQPDRPSYRYDAVVCSAAQQARAEEYVRAAAQGKGYEIIEAGRRQSHPLLPGDLERVPGMNLAEILAAYGPPRDVWPRYPDGLTWIYRLIGHDEGAAIDFDRTRSAVRVRRLCETLEATPRAAEPDNEPDEAHKEDAQ